MLSDVKAMDCQNDQAASLGKLKEVRQRLLDSMKDGIPATKVSLSPDAPDTLRASHTVYSRKSY
jgi:hypothetical protein